MDKTTAKPTDISQLILKLRNEYNNLKERVGSLHSFMCDIDFEKRVPDPVEQRLMREQLHMMLGYMENLRARISYQEQQQLRNMIETSIPHAPIASVEKRGGDIIIKQANPSGQDVSDSTEQTGDGKRGIDFVRCENGKVVAIVPEGLIPKGLDDVDINKAFDELAKAWKAYCEENHDLYTNHCGQDAHDPCGELGTEGNPIPLPSPVDDGSAAVDDDLPENLKKLVGMQVVSVGDMPCDGCPVDHYGAPCVKVELVGGTILCLSPLPNSIITE